MATGSRLLHACFVILLAGCLPGRALAQVASDVPAYTDALAGVYKAPASSVPRDVPLTYYEPGGGSGKPGRAVLNMALVPGANYHATRTYMTAFAAIAGPNARYMNPQPLVTRAVQIIKDRYAWLETAPDLDTAAKRESSLTLVLDVRTRIGTWRADTTAVQIEVVAFDEKQQPVGRYVAEGKAPSSDEANGFPGAAQQALNALGDIVKKYFN